MNSIVTNRIQTRIHSTKLTSLMHKTDHEFNKQKSINVRTIFNVHKKYNPQINPEFKNQVSNRSTNLNEKQNTSSDQIRAIRSELILKMLIETNKELFNEYRIELMNLHFKYLNYSTQVHNQIIKKIKTNRKKNITSYVKIRTKCIEYIDHLTKTK